MNLKLIHINTQCFVYAACEILTFKQLVFDNVKLNKSAKTFEWCKFSVVPLFCMNCVQLYSASDVYMKQPVPESSLLKCRTWWL